MFKGSQAKQEVLEEALSTLQPRIRSGRDIVWRGGGNSNGGSNPWNTSTPSATSEYDSMLQLQNQMKVLQDQAQADSDVAQRLKELREREQQAAEQAKVGHLKSEVLSNKD